MKKTIHIIISLYALTYLSACQKKTNVLDVPADVLPPAKMVSVQIRLHLAEAKAMQSRIGADTADALYLHYQKEVLAQQQIDTATYKRSFRFYSQHPAEFDKIYAQVIDSLGLRESTNRWE
ncbi:protein of unknown function [Flexibacter flexilis DSM 6793]|uniref:DUF4296 domain-containing protein n=1 Tax=Flexibacter flexilis DSM 6793 TaxID=927664 RepID=A0A1I1DMK0_9BACT|nr:DUF4296 domain-containing protein [Flexibacter flexilis]SFB76067.1 protein of unknown function [Flexibacter flexilis DSM 6793]